MTRHGKRAKEKRPRLNLVQKTLRAELFRTQRADCRTLEEELVEAAGASDDERLGRLESVLKRAVEAGCQDAVLSCLRALALEYATRPDSDGAARIKAEYARYEALFSEK